MLAEMSVYSSECIKTNHEIQFAEGGEKHGVFPRVFLRRAEGMNEFCDVGNSLLARRHAGFCVVFFLEGYFIRGNKHLVQTGFVKTQRVFI